MGNCLGGTVQIHGPIKMLYPWLHYDDVVVCFGQTRSVSVRVYPKSSKLPPTVYVTLTGQEANRVWNLDKRESLISGEANDEYVMAYKKLGKQFDDLCVSVYHRFEYAYFLRMGWSMEFATNEQEADNIRWDWKHDFDQMFDGIFDTVVADFVSSLPPECDDAVREAMRVILWRCVLQTCDYVSEYCHFSSAADTVNILMKCVESESSSPEHRAEFSDIGSYVTYAKGAVADLFRGEAPNDQCVGALRLYIKSYLNAIHDRGDCKSDHIFVESIVAIRYQNKWEDIFRQWLDGGCLYATECTVSIGTATVELRNPVVEISEKDRQLLLTEYRLRPDILSQVLVPFLWDVVRPLAEAIGSD